MMGVDNLRSRPFLVSAALCVLLLVAPFLSALAGDSLVGKITAVKSANLITLDYGVGTYDIRIVGIELAGDNAIKTQARGAMSALVLGKTVRMRFRGRAPDGTMYGKIFVGGIGRERGPVRDAGLELVRAGLVRGLDVEYKYHEMSRAEAEAKKARRGLWK